MWKIHDIESTNIIKYALFYIILRLLNFISTHIYIYILFLFPLFHSLVSSSILNVIYRFYINTHFFLFFFWKKSTRKQPEINVWSTCDMSLPVPKKKCSNGIYLIGKKKFASEFWGYVCMQKKKNQMKWNEKKETYDSSF
jgi:hypothetical protein